MKVHHLRCEELVEEDLRAGDVVYLTGKIVTARDKAHMRVMELLESGRKDEIPEELFSCPIYHCGPLVKRDDEIRVLSAGPTTSARMNAYAPKLLELSSCPVIIGKGGMSEEVMKALMRRKGAYLAFPGGAGALAAERIEKVEKVYWEDLGMAEAVYVLRVREFGPCVVGIDSKGNTLYVQLSVG